MSEQKDVGCTRYSCKHYRYCMDTRLTATIYRSRSVSLDGLMALESRHDVLYSLSGLALPIHVPYASVFTLISSAIALISLLCVAHCLKDHCRGAIFSDCSGSRFRALLDQHRHRPAEPTSTPDGLFCSSKGKLTLRNKPDTVPRSPLQPLAYALEHRTPLSSDGVYPPGLSITFAGLAPY